MVLTAYADPDVNAVARAGMKWSTALDPQVQSRISPTLDGDFSSDLLTWPIGGALTNRALDALVGGGASTVLLSDSSLPGAELRRSQAGRDLTAALGGRPGGRAGHRQPDRGHRRPDHEARRERRRRPAVAAGPVGDPGRAEPRHRPLRGDHPDRATSTPTRRSPPPPSPRWSGRAGAPRSACGPRSAPSPRWTAARCRPGPRDPRRRARAGRPGPAVRHRAAGRLDERRAA